MKHRNSWRNRLVLAVVLIGMLLALPNLASDPALHVSSESGSPLAQSSINAMAAELAVAGIRPAAAASVDGAVSLRFDSPDDQRRAADILAAAQPGSVIAFTSVPRLPDWLRGLGLKPVSLGLDLVGGVQFTYEVDLATVTSRLLSNLLAELQADLRDDGIAASGEIADDELSIQVRGATAAAAVRDALGALREPGSSERTLDYRQQRTGEQRSDGPRSDEQQSNEPQSNEPQANEPRDTQGAGAPRANAEYRFTARIRDEVLAEHRRQAMQQNILTLRNRVNELGLSEPVVASLGANRILVQIPGARDQAQIQRILGSTATIEWHLKDTANDAEAAVRDRRAPAGSILRWQADGTPALLRREVIASGEHLIDAAFTYAQGEPVVSVRLNRAGAERMLETTRNNVGRPLAVLLVEETRERVVGDADSTDPGVGNGDDPGGYRQSREETVIFLGRIASVFSSDFVLTGLPATQAQDLAVLLRSGALAAPIFEVGQSTTVSPTLGQDNIRMGRNALIAGFVLVVVFMAVYYRVFGLIANLALVLNVVLLVGLLSALGASLTLTGMAGIVLTVGMAVDANVLIFERIREELAAGSSPQASIRAGYEKAFSTIADANVTTLLAALALFLFGTGPIRGFAVTLGLGILTSMFTAIVLTRSVVDIVYGGRKPRRLSIGG